FGVSRVAGIELTGEELEVRRGCDLERGVCRARACERVPVLGHRVAEHLVPAPYVGEIPAERLVRGLVGELRRCGVDAVLVLRPGACHRRTVDGDVRACEVAARVPAVVGGVAYDPPDETVDLALGRDRAREGDVAGVTAGVRRPRVA